MLTREGIFVAVQRSELFSVVAAERVACVALIGAKSEPVSITLRLQAEAAVLGIHFLPRPVLKLHHQLVVALFPQVVDVDQPEPVLTVYVPKSSLQETQQVICYSLRFIC